VKQLISKRELIEAITLAGIAMGLAALVACAHTNQKTLLDNQVQTPQGIAELLPGMRPIEQGCVMPPKTFEGEFLLFKETCSHIDGMAAGCSYFGKVALGTFWACGITIMQRDCHSEFIPYQMRCMPWDDNAEILLRNLKEANQE
jgi:hypothetical protein